MPHITIKLYPGKTEEQKESLSKAIVSDIMEIMGNSEASVSVAFEEVEPEQWKEVYREEILPKMDSLYKKPGYNPL
ncbi:tautomerase PptA [Robertkochia solimangrovi]|uniref:tautomerase PptA n=1 Tax=Robertkochia solimangrovi TaxID=2213046 RepID=UPI00117FD866|nr:tautomerase PptA [Robertkochia solimangrovi]TRZ46102.1 tautomerase PptA [Robertkochia solimangrovi]